MSRRIFQIVLVTVVFGVWCVFLRPTFLGGPIGYVIVSGHSMEPLLHTGDFVVTRRGDYQQGDIIAFHASGSGGIVIHRIVGGNAKDGFVTQGDNRQTPDDWHPRDSEVIGKSWIQVPGAGTWLAHARQPLFFASVLGLLGFLVVVTNRTHKRKFHREGVTMNRDESVHTKLSIAPLWVLAGFAVVLVMASVLAAVFTFTRAAYKTESVQAPRYSQSTSFNYTVLAQPSTLYPDGHIGPVRDGAAASALPPIYSKLVQGLDVGFHYQLDGASASNLAGTYDAKIVVAAGEDDWTRSQDVIASTPFQGPSFDGQVHVDLPALQALIDSIEKETGVVANFYGISVILDVNVSGAIEDETLTDGQQPVLAFRLSRSRLTTPTELVISKVEDRGATVTVAREVGIEGLAVTVSRARVASVGGIVLGFGLVGVLGAAYFTGFWQSSASILRTRYGAIVVPVSRVEERGSRTVCVESLADLGRLAQHSGGVVYSERRLRSTRYFVLEGETTVQYDTLTGPVSGLLKPEPTALDGHASDQPAAS